MRRSIAILLFPLLAVPVQAELLTMRDGSILQGSILSQDRDRVVIRTETGTRSIPKVLIQRIVYDATIAAAVIAEREAEEAERENRARAEEEREAREREARLLQARGDREAYLASARAAEEAYRRAQQPQPTPQPEPEPQPEVLEPEPTPPPAYDRWGPFLRSLAVPGWGQVYAGQTTAGLLYGSAFTLASLNAVALRNVAIDARSSYRSFTDTSFLLPFAPGVGTGILPYVYLETSSRSLTYENASNRLQGASYLVAGVYVIQLVHAFFLEKEIEAVSAGTPEGASGQSGFGMAMFYESTEPGPVSNLPTSSHDRVDLFYAWRF